MANTFGDYVAIQDEETARRIMHMPGIMAHMVNKGRELVNDTGSSNFEAVLLQTPGWLRPVVYVLPANNDGIREELSQAVLLKAALAMVGR